MIPAGEHHAVGRCWVPERTLLLDAQARLRRHQRSVHTGGTRRRRPDVGHRRAQHRWTVRPSLRDDRILVSGTFGSFSSAARRLDFRARRALAGTSVQLLRNFTRVTDALLASELVTNAVNHAGGATRILVVHDDHNLLFEVHDDTHNIPKARDTGGPAGGFGLRIVARASESWGWNQTATGKVVWATVPCCPDDLH
jgi:hypothetical protein